MADFQTIAALACVALAAGAVARRAVRLVRGERSCGGCGTCPGPAASRGPRELIALRPPGGSSRQAESASGRS